MDANNQKFSALSARRSPRKTIRAYCVYCNGGIAKEVETCDANGKNTFFHACPFHSYRMGKGRPSVKSIRKFCLQCMGDSRKLVSECETMDCLCHPYRMGKNPNRSSKGYFAGRVITIRLKNRL